MGDPIVEGIVRKLYGDTPDRYTTYVEGRTLYSGDSLEDAVRTWDRETCGLGKSVAGGISVQQYENGVMVRDGWVLHVMEDGSTYLHPRVTLS